MKDIQRFLAVALGASALISAVTTVRATNGNPINSGSAQKYTVSVIGDVPYGDRKIAAFPQFIDFINADPKVDIVVHLGDIKSGSTWCSDEYFQFISEQFDRLKDPLVFTPGDNEWTDCHRLNNNQYLPVERLAKLREVFFPVPGETIGGRHKRVLTQGGDPAFSDFVENVIWMESKVIFATLNVPGSNNDGVETNPWRAPWDSAFYKLLQAEEQESRNAANMDWLHKTFEMAAANGAMGVVLMLQADMWDGTTAELNAYPPLVAAIGHEALAFGGPVLLLVGDSHTYTVDNPYDPASPLHAIHPGTPDVPNITRVIVQGSTTAPNEFEYLRLTIDPRSPDLFSWDRVPFEIP
ncbi:MAG: metallophosphoesterase [Verrucomicrobiales bacterium]|nr:metallophosphoesterase [Verrucomicrobiales bacterium]